MRTDVHAVAETSEMEELEAEPEQRPSRPRLHEAETPSALTEQELRDARKRHLAFKQIGRSSDAGLLSPEGIVPLPLYPYVDVDSLRGDFPVCAFDEPEAGVMPLTRVFELAVAGLGLEGDDLERCRHWALQMEARIRHRAVEGEGERLFKLWNACSEELSNQYRDDTDKQKRLHDDLTIIRKSLRSDASLITFDEAAPLQLLEALRRNEVSGPGTAVQTLTEILQRLHDLLSLEFEESDTGLAPDHLKESVGEAFQSDLDFDALSTLLHDAPHGERLSPARRERIVRIVEILESYLKDLQERPKALERVSESDRLVERVQSMRQTEASISGAWMAARLEVANRFDADRHGTLLDDRMPHRWGEAVPTPAPLPPVHIDLRTGYSAADAANLAELFDRGIPVRVLVTVGDVVSGGETDASEPYLPASLGERLVGSGKSSGFVCQRSLANVESLLAAMKTFLRCESTAVLVVYDGTNFGSDGMHPYLRSAAGTESRVVPALISDENGSSWADRFSIEGNEQFDRIWPETAVEVSDDPGRSTAHASSFSAAALMLCDPRFSDHFECLDRREWHDDLIPIEKYSGDPQQIPFLEAASDDGAIQRVIVSDYVWSQTMRVAERWTSLRELGGIQNSFALKAVREEKERLEAEFRDRTKALEDQHRNTLETTTGKLAQEIVANIAAGLLDEASKGSPPPRPRQEAFASRVAAADETQAEEEVPPEEVAPPDEETPEVFDEAYVESPRCTACDECTTLNGRMFAYNENKQAYITDVTAGTFRELVLAAEKCPVRIIHPGKPLDPDEPHLDELMKRAEPFL